MCCSESDVFSWEVRIFHQGNVRTHFAHATTMLLQRHKVRVLVWPTSSLDLSSIVNVWCNMRRRDRMATMDCAAEVFSKNQQITQSQN